MVDATLGKITYFVQMSSKTAFFKLQDIFPECFFYRDSSPRIEPLVCLQEDNACSVGSNCMETLVRRLHMLFEEVVPTAELVILYFKSRNDKHIRAGVFYRNLKDFRIITMNPFGWKAIKQRGKIFKFTPTQNFFLTGKSDKEETDIDTETLE